MSLLTKKQVLVLAFASFSTILWTSGCAGFAEPLPSLSITPNVLSVSAKVGTTSSQAVSVTNIGTTTVSVTQAIINGAGFGVTGLTTPLSLAAGQTESFTVKFAAPTVGSVNGSLTIITDVRHRPVVLSLHGSGGTNSPDVASVTVTPVQASPAPGTRVQFTAAVQGTTANDSVTWTTSMGTIAPTGIYTAPARAATGTVTATSVADPTKSASAVVTVAAVSTPLPAPTPSPTSPVPTVISVTVSPATASSVTSGTLTFTAKVQGTTTNTGVTWKAALGSITSSGVYTASAKAGSDTVTATSVADTTKSASATVTVTAAPTSTPAPTVTSVTVSPTSASSTTNGTLQFSATVQGTTSDTSVNWKAALGQISPSGLYTAPSNPGTDTVTATSDADASKSASAQVNVSAPNSGALPAFPGAQGGGAASVGGRGGAVFEVTNLNDGGTGSLRACIEASGPRICVFRVAGMITQKSDMTVNNPYLTVAGQTAPGQVIIGGPGNTGEALRISTHDTIVRYVTFSADDVNTPSGPDTGTVGYSITNATAYNNILDHASMRWAGNKSWIMFSGFGACESETTLEWSLLYEPHEGHPVGPSTSTNDNATTSECEPDYDTHHSMFVNIDHRIPEYNNRTMRWINNITYNYSWYAVEALGATQSDIIGNIWDYANLVPSQSYPIHSSDGNWPGSIPGTPSFYIAGNIGHGRTTANPDQIGDLTYQITGENGSEVNGNFPSSWLRSSPLASPNSFPIVPDPAQNLGSLMLPTVGNSQWRSRGDRPRSKYSAVNECRSTRGPRRLVMPGGRPARWPAGVRPAVCRRRTAVSRSGWRIAPGRRSGRGARRGRRLSGTRPGQGVRGSGASRWCG